MLEAEKRELEVKINCSTRATSIAKSEVSTTSTDDDNNVETLKGQVDFLNSVIVDMQKKNDELKAKLEILESAGILETIDTADMVMLNGIDTNRVAPR